MNQGAALVHIYMDGSVLVAHGGTEMGQGLYTVSNTSTLSYSRTDPVILPRNVPRSQPRN